MSSIGTGYDLVASTFSPDGRIFQVEYAQKAVDNSGTCIGIRCKDGVLLCVEKLISSKLDVAKSNPRIANVNDGVGFAGAGMYPDSRSLLQYAREHSIEHYDEYRQMVPIEDLVHQVAMYAQMFTLSAHRAFGCSAFFAGWDKLNKQAHLYLVEPSGLSYEYYAWAVGKHRQGAKAELEKLKFNEITVKDMINQAAKIILTVRDESKDKNYMLEMGYVSDDSNGKFRQLSADKVAEAEAWAKQALEDEDDDEMDA